MGPLWRDAPVGPYPVPNPTGNHGIGKPLDRESYNLGVKEVAMIFDDGPDLGNCARFLELFREIGGRATFSYIGEKVDASPELARAAFEAGHEIMNHTYTHPRLPELPDDQIVEELRKTQEAVLRATGKAPERFWLPYGAFDDRVLATIEACGSPKNYFANDVEFVSTDDWNEAIANEETIERAALSIKSDRAVVLGHEWPKATIAILPSILGKLKKRGYRFVTVGDLSETL